LSEPANVSPEPVASPKRTSELGLRVASGLIMALLALGSAWFGEWPFGVFWTVASVMVLREWLGLIGLTGRRLTMNWVAGSAAIAVGGMMAEVSPLPEPLAWVVALLGAGVVAAASPASLRLWAAAGVLYAAVIAIVPIDLRSSPAHGFVAVLWLFAVVWLTDIGAYFAGRAIGGPKLWPAVSPKKTWAGFIGGVIAGTLTAVLIVQTARYGFGIGWFSDGSLIAVSVVGAIVSQGGDLLESALKRKFHVKDSSHLIPGHGGFMDRLDSFWAVCVLLAVFLYATGGPG
jgi:phosphatidate cytidylyltransferase